MKATTMDLFYLSHQEQDGYNLDLMVQAKSPRDAITMWKAHWHEFFEQNDQLSKWPNKPFPYNSANSRRLTDEDEILRIWKLTNLEVSTVPVVIDWSVDPSLAGPHMLLVAYMVPEEDK